MAFELVASEETLLDGSNQKTLSQSTISEIN